MVALPLTLLSQSWQTLGGGTDASVVHLLSDEANGYLYASGLFTSAGSSDCNCIARWNGSAWDSLAGGGLGCPGSRVFDMILYKDDLYAYGSMHDPNDLEVSRWNGSTWQQITTADGSINGFMQHDDTLYITGSFTTINGVLSPRIIKYDGTNFYPVDPALPFEPAVFSSIHFENDLYIGGSFSDASNSINDLAVFKNGTWQSVGNAVFTGSFTSVSDMVVYKDELIVAGFFSESEGAPGNSIAAWDGQNWKQLGSGLSGLTNPAVQRLVVHGDKLYVVGIFRSADNASVHSIAVWDGSIWCGIEGEIEVSVSSVAFFQDNMVIAGTNFGDIGVGGTQVENIAFLENFESKEDSCSWPLGENPIPSEESVLLYPNPTSSEQTLTVSNLHANDATIEIIDIGGRVLKLIYQGEIRNKLTFDVSYSSFDPGIYFYAIDTSDGRKILKKTIILQ